MAEGLLLHELGEELARDPRLLPPFALVRLLSLQAKRKSNVFDVVIVDLSTNFHQRIYPPMLF